MESSQQSKFSNADAKLKISAQCGRKMGSRHKKTKNDYNGCRDVVSRSRCLLCPLGFKRKMNPNPDLS